MRSRRSPVSVSPLSRDGLRAAAPVAAGRRRRSLLLRASSSATIDQPAVDRVVELTGRVVPYGSVTDVGPYTEEFQRGAFAESLRVTPNVPLLRYHDARQHPIGVLVQWEDRVDGLHCTFQLDTSKDAQEVARLARNGFLGFFSIGFQPDQDGGTQWTRRLDREHLIRTKARLLEVSVVSTPAYALAKITGVGPDAGVRDLATSCGAPLLMRAITGTVDERRISVGLVRRYVEEFGATAPAELARLAEFGSSSRQLRVNLARAAGALADGDGRRMNRIHFNQIRRDLLIASSSVDGLS